MPRLALEAPRAVAELAALPVHVVVRDFPETMAVFRRFGVDVPAAGGGHVADACPDAGPLLDAIETAVAWRSRA